MDLKTFIFDTLTQITEGVKDAINKVGEDNGFGCINPRGEKDLETCLVSFDVALTVEESQSNTNDIAKETGGTLKIAGFFSLGHKKQNSNAQEIQDRNQSISRIQFSVPIRLTETKDLKKEGLEEKKKKEREDSRLKLNSMSLNHRNF